MQRGILLLSTLMIALTSAPSNLSAQEAMNNRKMQQILSKETDKMEGEAGSWMIYYREHILLILTDEGNNRMRIFSPIVEEEKLSAGQMRKMLHANFHTALDAKYAFYEGFAVSVFTHPLAELGEVQLVDALRQVVALADTFGTTYSSSDLRFGGTTTPDDRRINQSPRKN
jgi:hypothetical protein